MKYVRSSAAALLFLGCTARPEAAPQSPVPAAAPSPPVDRASLGKGAIAPRPDPNNVSPIYPEALRSRGVEGEVVAKLHIDREGNVVGMKLLRIEPRREVVPDAQLFVDAVSAAVRTWKFEPARLVDGESIAVWHTLSVPFRLRDPE